MNEVFSFFALMEPFEKVLWVVALVSTAIFIGQVILTFVGMDAADGVSADFDGDMSGESEPFQLFSLRNLVNFCMGFGWAAIVFYEKIESPAILSLIAFGFGALVLAVFFFVMNRMNKLNEDHTMNLNNAIGKTGTTYLRIPENQSGRGKVQIVIQGASRELDAMTRGEAIPTGSGIKVVEVMDNLLIVVKN